MIPCFSTDRTDFENARILNCRHGYRLFTQCYHVISLETAGGSPGQVEAQACLASGFPSWDFQFPRSAACPRTGAADAMQCRLGRLPPPPRHLLDYVPPAVCTPLHSPGYTLSRCTVHRDSHRISLGSNSWGERRFAPRSIHPCPPPCAMASRAWLRHPDGIGYFTYIPIGFCFVIPLFALAVPIVVRL